MNSVPIRFQSTSRSGLTRCASNAHRPKPNSTRLCVNAIEPNSMRIECAFNSVVAASVKGPLVDHSWSTKECVEHISLITSIHSNYLLTFNIIIIMTSLIEKHMLCWVQCAVEHYILDRVQEGEQWNPKAARSWTGPYHSDGYVTIVTI